MANIQDLVGKTIKAIDYPGKYDNITIQFTDGTEVKIIEFGYAGEFRVKVNNKFVYFEDDE